MTLKMMISIGFLLLIDGPSMQAMDPHLHAILGERNHQFLAALSQKPEGIAEHALVANLRYATGLTGELNRVNGALKSSMNSDELQRFKTSLECEKSAYQTASVILRAHCPNSADKTVLDDAIEKQKLLCQDRLQHVIRQIGKVMDVQLENMSSDSNND